MSGYKRGYNLKEKNMYYFAYGSNHNLQQMRDRCPHAQRIGSAILQDVQLVFIGEQKHRAFASLAMSEGASTPITIYELNDTDVAALDHFEGVAKGQYRKEHWKIRYEGNRIEGLIYLKNEGAYNIPSDEYLERILKGYKDQGLDLKSIYLALDLSKKHEGKPCLNKI